MNDRRETDVLEIDPEAQEPGNPELAPEGDSPEKPDKKEPAQDETLKEMRRTVREQRLALKESNDAARYWMEQARGGGGTKKEPDPDPEPTTSVDLVEAVTSGDSAAIAKAMSELGFVRKADVDRDIDAKIGATRRQVTDEQKLYETYPELTDEKSPFFKATAKIYNELAAKDPSLKKSGTLVEIAAELADRRLNGGEARGAGKRAAEPEGDFEIDDTDEEEERVARVRRQTGDRGQRSSSRGAGDPDSQNLDRTQKTIVAKLRAAGADITEDGYRKRATAGVRMSGLPTRRARF